MERRQSTVERRQAPATGASERSEVRISDLAVPDDAVEADVDVGQVVGPQSCSERDVSPWSWASAPDVPAPFRSRNRINVPCDRTGCERPTRPEPFLGGAVVHTVIDHQRNDDVAVE